MPEYAYWNKDFSSLVPLGDQVRFDIDMAGMRAFTDFISDEIKAKLKDSEA